MPTCHRGAEVANDTVQVVIIRRCHGLVNPQVATQCIRTPSTHTSLHLFVCKLREHATTEVEAVDGEIYGRRDFPGFLVKRSGEALEVDDEYLRCSGDRDLFRCLTIFLAVWTTPYFVTGEALFSTVGTEAGIDVAITRLGYFDADAVEGFIRGGGETAGHAS